LLHQTRRFPAELHGLAFRGRRRRLQPTKTDLGAARLNYNMYTTPSYTIVWGDGTSGTSVENYNANQNQNQISFTDYGRVPASQFVTAGSYTDTITVTVTY